DEDRATDPARSALARATERPLARHEERSRHHGRMAEPSGSTHVDGRRHAGETRPLRGSSRQNGRAPAALGHDDRVNKPRDFARLRVPRGGKYAPLTYQFCKVYEFRSDLRIFPLRAEAT